MTSVMCIVGHPDSHQAIKLPWSAAANGPGKATNGRVGARIPDGQTGSGLNNEARAQRSEGVPARRTMCR